MENLRVLYVLDDTSLFGAAQSFLDLIMRIKERVVPVIIIRNKSELEKRFEEEGISYYIVKFGTNHFSSANVKEDTEIADFIDNYDAAKQVAYIIEKENVQLVHINSSVNNVGALAALMKNIPYVWHIRELIDEHYDCVFLNWSLKKALFDRADCLISISEYVKERYKDKYALESYRLYDGHNEDRYVCAIDKNKVINNIFLIAGAISPQKGQLNAIQAIQFVKTKYKEIQLIIAGSGPELYIWALRKYIHIHNLEDNVIFAGFQKDLSVLRAKAGYALTCSKSEALGRVTVEAMFAGNFVIGARSGATTEILGENESRGLLYEFGNYKELADTMIRAIEMSYEQKMKIIMDAQEYVMSSFAINNYLNQLVELYREKTLKFSKEKDTLFLKNLEDRRKQLYQKNTEKPNTVSLESFYKAQKAFQLSVEWLKILQSGRKLEAYFIHFKIHTIAIYGMADLGRCLYDELENSTIVVKYIVDRNPGIIGSVLNFTALEKEQIFVDMIVVTVAAAEQYIVKEIQDKGYNNVVGLSEIIDFLKRNDA